jgi:hypothetical protein
LELLRGVFDLGVRRKPQVFAAVAVMLVGIMDIEWCLVIGQMQFGAAMVADRAGRG